MVKSGLLRTVSISAGAVGVVVAATAARSNGVVDSTLQMLSSNTTVIAPYINVAEIIRSAAHIVEQAVLPEVSPTAKYVAVALTAATCAICLWKAANNESLQPNTPRKHQ